MTTTFLTRTGAADYLTRRLGRRITVTALEMRAFKGTGPRYRIERGRAAYAEADIEAWARERMA